MTTLQELADEPGFGNATKIIRKTIDPLWKKDGIKPDDCMYTVEIEVSYVEKFEVVASSIKAAGEKALEEAEDEFGDRELSVTATYKKRLKTI